jgi:hypothetical protein
MSNTPPPSINADITQPASDSGADCLVNPGSRAVRKQARAMTSQLQAILWLGVLGVCPQQMGRFGEAIAPMEAAMRCSFNTGLSIPG